MRAKLLNSQDQKTYAIIFDKGEEFVAGMQEFAQQHPGAASFTAIGAFSSATLGYFDRERMDYNQIAVGEQTEVLALVGDIARHKDKPKVHAHVVLGRADGTTRGGHILEARVWPTLEVVLTESPQHLRRVIDEETGLALIDIG
jgi:predicted DNA-binding protein with PD1-like motif